MDQHEQRVGRDKYFVVFIRQTDQAQIGGRRHRYVSDILQVTPDKGGQPAFSSRGAPGSADR